MRRLAALDPERSLIRDADSRVVILTGQSSFVSSRLSGEQQSFLESVAPAGFELVMSGFPYHSDLLDIREEPSLMAASWRNAAQTIWSGASATFRRVLAGTLERVLARTRRHVAVVAGSCGLQLANAVWPILAKPAGLDIRVIALGPACFGPLRMDGAAVSVLQGRKDRWSRLYYRGRVDHAVDCGHLDYWTSAEVREITAAAIAR